MTISRRDLVRLGVGTGAGLLLPGSLRAASTGPVSMLTRPIPSTGEQMPVVGIGTARVFDVEPGTARWNVQAAVLSTFADLGGRMIDTAPSYGRAEQALGAMISDLGLRPRLFLATKVRQTGTRQGLAEMQASLAALRSDAVDLVAVHNLVDTDRQLGTIRDWKAAGRVRYSGITTFYQRQYDAFAQVMREQQLDCIQIDYSLASRQSAETILPLAADLGIAVVINVPFGRGRLFQRVGGRAVPAFAREFGADTWAKFFLKYILSHPAVTCVIPGTDRVEYVRDNVGAGTGDLPDAPLRARMEAYFDALPG